jgi:hypothetical protein
MVGVVTNHPVYLAHGKVGDNTDHMGIGKTCGLFPALLKVVQAGFAAVTPVLFVKLE